jgi:hypothetical protein
MLSPQQEGFGESLLREMMRFGHHLSTVSVTRRIGLSREKPQY